jgi:hypothetical protein
MDRKFVVIAAVMLVLSASVIAPLAGAKGHEGRGERGEFREKGFEKGEGWRIRGGDWDRWHGGGGISYYGGYGGYYPSYTYVQPVPYPVYVPANFGGDQGACYQACVNSGQYSPAQCGQWCYYA